MKSSNMRESGAGHTAPNRRQSARQQRTTTTRPANYYARSFGRGTMGAADTASTTNSTPGFFPAITHFTDSITALPKEAMKHFSMLKEVEAKTHQPDQDLQNVADAVARLQAPTRREARLAARAVSNTTGNNSANGSVAGSVGHDQTPTNQQQSAELIESANDGNIMGERAITARRELFMRFRFHLSQMCAMLDEKNAVLSSANQTMDKQLSRMDSSFQHIDEELSFEARYGSFSHWAYKDGDESKKKTTNERSRREVAAANNLAAAAAAVHEGDIAASRSEARREAVMAKQKNRHHHYGVPDFEDVRPTKKAPTNRGKKAAQPLGPPDARNYGLGILNGPEQPTKRRKTEKAAAAAPAMERSLSGAINNAHTGRASPRETPAVEGTKKRSRAGPGPGAAKKRNQHVGAQSPQVPSSPVVGNFSTLASNGQRPQSARARQNSTTNSLNSNSNAQETTRIRPGSSASNRPVNGTANPAETEPSAGYTVPGPALPVAQVPLEPAPAGNGALPDRSSMKREETENQEGPGTPAQSIVTRGAGRQSKTATPVIGAFPSDVSMARSRSTRNNGSSHASSESNVPLTSHTTQKRSHKKAGAALQPRPHNVGDGSGLPGEISGPDLEDEVAEEDEDGDQERFCYCNGVSYGEMIGCDNPNCTRQWFHYACVGITKEPNKKASWYCNECKENMRRSRPGSRPGH
ncbi:hypothetical protein IWX49DRAFT_587517 [Phyllosticta citricarpa]|uniref:PHD-type domain-containing protein n=2 Tax=Phyllosticta TaxID=121621 RepID=A0ABR1MQT3_9PEZI